MLQQDSKPTIYDSKITNNTNKWLVVNDGVMGGLSKSNISVGENGIVLFKGSVTTENNGGFASVYYSFASKNISSFSHIVLRIKGDIKEYQFRIREEQKQSHWYIKTFLTSGEWETIKIPLSNFYPSFRGSRLDLPNFPGKTMQEIAFLIGNKIKESFQLEIESISLQ